MTLDGAKSEADEDKISLLSDTDAEPRAHGGIVVPKADTTKAKSSDSRHVYLSAPNAPPIRPLSPDTFSNLSLDEYEQLRRSISGSGGPSRPAEGSLPAPSGWRSRLDQFWIRNKGIAYMLLGQVFGVLMNVTTRLLEVEGNKGKGLHPFQILFARMSITFSLASGYMWHMKTPHFPLGAREVRSLLIARGLGGFFGVFGMYYSLLYLPLADATVITFLSPGLACYACSILLKEPYTRLEQIGSLISLAGVVLIARPTSLFTVGGSQDTIGNSVDGAPAMNATAPSESDASSYENVTPVQRLTAVGIALIGVVGSTMAYTTIRWIGRRAHPLITVNYFSGWCLFVSIVMQSVLPDVGWVLPADLKEWGYLIFLGTCGFAMQFLMATALAYEKSSRTTNMVYSSMLFALLFDKLIFNHTPDVPSILGSSLILGSAITVAMQQSPNTNQQKEGVDGSGADEESRTGLISGVSDVETAEDHDRLPVQEIQLRTLR